MIISSFKDYSDVQILAEETVTCAKILAANVDANNANIKVMLKNCAPFEKCIRPLTINHSFIITHIHRIFFKNNATFRLIICYR